MHSLRPYDVRYLQNPSQVELRALALAHTPTLFQTAVGNLVKQSRNKARMAAYTYIIVDDPSEGPYSGQTIDRARAEALIASQRAYIEARGTLIEVQGFLGLGPRAVGVQWLYTLEGANIAGMQSVLSFPPAAVLGPDQPFEARLQVIYTPDHFVDEMPGRQAILVDLKAGRTHIMGPDYFGESKKAALRMLNKLVFDEGGLVLHAGAKLVESGADRMTLTVMGLSGTGKTTTTFSRQGEVTRPIQDDMVGIWSNGELSVTENGCFAKTAGLTEESEPVIYRGTLSADAWLENVYIDENGQPDFFKAELSPEDVGRLASVLVQTGANPEAVNRYSQGDVPLAELLDDTGQPRDGWDFVVWTANGRSILPMANIEDAADLHALPPVRSMGILNRDEGADASTPGLVRFTSPEQAAGYFMLGETSKTSAAGKERGKTRSPFTQPFFPLAHGLQARRFSELAATMPQVGMWLMNTGFVGGDSLSVKRGEGHKVGIAQSSALLEALVKGEIAWARDPDFGYEVVDIDHPANAALLAQVPAAVLDPRRWFADRGHAAAYAAGVAQLKQDRTAFLRKHGVDEQIIAAVQATG